MRGARISYGESELRWIEANCGLARADIHRRFCERFCRDDVTVDNIKGLCSRMEWSAGPDGKRRNKGKSQILTDDQIAWLRRNHDLSRRDLGPAFRAAHPDSPATDAQLISWRKRNGVRTGRNGRFEPGQTPWSKGRKLKAHPNSKATQFKRGLEPHNAKPIGYERLDGNGYVLVCVDRPNPWTGAPTHMAFKHKEMWIAANGPVSDGHVLKCLDGDKTNCDPSNWEAIPIGMLPRLNGIHGRDYDAAPAELKPTIMAIAKLQHRAREARKESKE
jgi:hypothetical protein